MLYCKNNLQFYCKKQTHLGREAKKIKQTTEQHENTERLKKNTSFLIKRIAVQIAYVILTND